jgi:hypothetical protein
LHLAEPERGALLAGSRVSFADTGEDERNDVPEPPALGRGIPPGRLRRHTMAELKTKPQSGSVKEFLKSIPDQRKRKDALILLDVFQKITGERPTLWGSAIVGFGDYHYRSERTGREGDWFLTGFSPRKQNLTLYIMSGFERYGPLLKALGKHKLGKGCLYINSLEDVDMAVLKQLLQKSVADMRKSNS